MCGNLILGTHMMTIRFLSLKLGVTTSLHIVCTATQGFLCSLGKPDVLDWYTGRSNFPCWSFLSPYAGRNFNIDHSLDSSPCDRISQNVLSNPDESASVVEPKGRTILTKVGKEETSSTDVPMALALVSQPDGKT
jgi:hypothetical protein